MPLDKKYPADFEKLWNAYPKWPSGRSVKHLAFKKFELVNRELEFNADDIAAILGDIEQRKRDCDTWQEGNKFGPKAMQSYIYQRLWNEPYRKASEAERNQRGRSTYNPDPVWKQYGYPSAQAYEDAQNAQAPRVSSMLQSLLRDLKKSTGRIH